MGNCECRKAPKGLDCMLRCRDCQMGVTCAAHKEQQKIFGVEEKYSMGKLTGEEWPNFNYQPIIDIASQAIQLNQNELSQGVPLDTVRRKRRLKMSLDYLNSSNFTTIPGQDHQALNQQDIP